MTVLSTVLMACGGAPEVPEGGAAGAAAGEAGAAAVSGGSAAPVTRRVEVVEAVHGVAVADPYRWLEDAGDPEVQAWMTAQNAHARAALDALLGRAALGERLRALAYVDQVSAPVVRGGRWFYVRRHADREKAIVYWRAGEGAAERVLLDPNAMGDGENISLGTWVPSWDGRRVAYAIRENNADEATLYVMEVESGAVSAVDVIPGAKYASPQWTPDGSGFYYTWLPVDESIPVAERPGHATVRFHRLGADPAKDAVIHPALGDPTRFISPALSRDGRWLFLYKWHGWSSVEIMLRDLRDPAWTEFRPFFSSEESQAYVIAWDGFFTIATNEGAPRWRVLRAPYEKPGREHWVEVVAEQPDAVIDGVQIVGGHLVLSLLREAASALEVRTLDGKRVRSVALPGIGAASGMSGEPDSPVAWFEYESFTAPTQVYETHVGTGETKLWAEVKLPIDPSGFSVERTWYTSKDGTRVSMFVVAPKGMRRDGSTPFVLYGYGGFQVSLTPAFSSTLYPWLEAGGGYAVAHLRGGGEYGEAWHRAGMRAEKQNVFDDYLAAADHLVAEGYTKPERLAAYGRSNGGLLVGAAMTQRPEAFGAVVCGVPLLDMVRFHRFGSGQTWTSEYGSAEDAAMFAALYAYSPYHRVEAGARYPATLFLSADNDDRVDPLHARKMAAALQHAVAGRVPVLLRIEREAGHGGADRTAQRVAEATDLWAFLMDRLGVTPPQ